MQTATWTKALGPKILANWEDGILFHIAEIEKKKE